MKRLGQRDLEVSLAYLRELYAQRDPERFKRHVLTTIGSVVASEFVACSELDVAAVADRQEAGVPAFSNPAELAEALDRYMTENPLFDHYRQTRDGRAVKISDFLTRGEFRRLGFYSEYWRKVGVDHRIALYFPTTPPAVIGFAIGRNAKDFSERDRLVLNLLYPHLTQAHGNAAALERTQQESLRVKRTVEKLGRAAVALGERGGFGGARGGPDGGSRSTSGRPKARVACPTTWSAGSSTNGRPWRTGATSRVPAARWSRSARGSASWCASWPATRRTATS
jgi:hypothetical protein